MELPFGRGRRFASDVPTAVDILIGGWQLSGIYQFQSGTPLGWGDIIFTGTLDDIDLSGSGRDRLRWFDTDAGFNKVSSQQLASNVRTFPLRLDNVRTHEVSNVDLSLIKNTMIKGVRADQRLDPVELPAKGTGDGETRLLIAWQFPNGQLLIDWELALGRFGSWRLDSREFCDLVVGCLAIGS